MIEISLPSPMVPFFKQRVGPLDGVEYTIQMEWNQRNGWYLGMLDRDGKTLLFPPKRVAGDWNLLLGETTEDLPPGRLVIVDTTLQGLDPTYESLGGTSKLIYFTEEELAL